MNILKNFYILVDALKYIEDNLCEPFSQEDIAKACFCSLSGLQKLFRYVFHHSLKEYITKRRLTCAAQDLSNSSMTISEIAYKYQYNSPEVFDRAFTKVWGIAPSAYKSKWKFTGIFPKIIFNYKGGQVMSHKRVDISDLYYVLNKNKGTFILCFDIMGLSPINSISNDAGDKAILECLKRIDEIASDDMILFRIGGDEFALVTGLNDADDVKKLAKQILSLNGNTIEYQGQSIPISMRAGATVIKDSNIRYSELFNNLQDTINNTRLNKLIISVME